MYTFARFHVAGTKVWDAIARLLFVPGTTSCRFVGSEVEWEPKELGMIETIVVLRCTHIGSDAGQWA